MFFFTDEQKAEALGRCFASAFVSNDDILLNLELRIQSNSEEMHYNCFREVVFHPYEVLKLLKSLKPSTSLTSDGIPQIVCKNALLLYTNLFL